MVRPVRPPTEVVDVAPRSVASMRASSWNARRAR